MLEELGVEALSCGHAAELGVAGALQLHRDFGLVGRKGLPEGGVFGIEVSPFGGFPLVGRHFAHVPLVA